jgi:hypothetical protein
MTKPSLRVTLLIWLVLTLTAWNAVGLWTALAWKKVLTQYSSQPAPAITLISSIIWLSLAVLLLWGILQTKAWTSKLLFWVSTTYTLWYWFERLAWENSHPNWLFAVVVNLAILIFISFTLRAVSREDHERKIENPTIK